MNGFVRPKQIRVTGTPRMSAQQFTLNLMVGTEYLFHLRIDLPTSEIPQGFIIRNSTKELEWLDGELINCRK
jgi:hypothetical protein